MKRKRTVRIFCILAVMMLVGSQLAVSAFAGTGKTKKVDYKEQSKDVTVTFDTSLKTGKFIAYYDIGKDAEGDQVIELSKIIDAFNDYAKNYGYDSYPLQPGDENLIQVVVTNSSGHSYKFKDGSFVLSTADTSTASNLTDAIGFDGQRIPFTYVGAMARSTPIQKLFGVTGSSRISVDMLCGIYDKLKEKGFEGDNALEGYLLDYYKVKSLDELSISQKVQIQGGLANAQFDISKEKMNELEKSYPRTMKFAKVKDLGDGNCSLQLKWPEANIAAMSYNLFYDSLISFGFGNDVDILDKESQTTPLDMAIADYMNNVGGIYQKTNEYFKSLTETKELIADGQSKIEFDMIMEIDGPNTDNAYQMYDLSWYNAITLEQTDVEQYYYDGDISITKNVTENGKPYQVNTTFYAALFDDEACTTLTKDSDGKPIIIPLELKGQDSVTVTTDKTIPRGTFYVAETDKDGNVVKSTDQLTVTISSPSITVTEEATAAVTITNDYKDYEGYYRENGDNPVTTTTETSSTTTDVTTEKPEAVQTGDDSTMAPYIAVLILAAAAAAAVAVTGRRKKITKK